MNSKHKKAGAYCHNAGVMNEKRGQPTQNVSPASVLLQIEPELGALFPRHVLDQQARDLAVRLVSAGRMARQFERES